MDEYVVYTVQLIAKVRGPANAGWDNVSRALAARIEHMGWGGGGAHLVESVEIDSSE